MAREELRYCDYCSEQLEFDTEYIVYQGMWFCCEDCLARYLLDNSLEEERELAKKYLLENTNYSYEHNFSQMSLYEQAMERKWEEREGR